MKTIETAILQFTDSQQYKRNLKRKNLENFPRNYSFGKNVYDDFMLRKAKIKNFLGLDTVKFHMAGTIKNKEEKKQYALETAIGFNKPLSSNLLTVINFLNDMTEDPKKIFDNKKYQDDFREATFLLKNKKIKIRETFNLKDEFRKRYEFNEYLFYDSKNNTIRHHSWEDKAVHYERVSVPKKEDIKLESLNSTLLELNARGLIGFDYDKIVKLKEQYRKQFFKAKKKDIAYYRRLIEEEQKTNHPLFSITRETSFNNIIDSLQDNEILNYFPFSSRFNVEFLAYVLRDKFGKRGNKGCD